MDLLILQAFHQLPRKVWLVAMEQKFFALSLLLLCAALRADQIEKSLNGENWQVSDTAGKVKDMPATVPGVVHLDLL